MAQKYVSKRDNEDFLEKLYAIGSATDVNDSRMRDILEVLSLVWAQFPVADRNWDEECKANGWEMPNQPLPRTGAIWTESELVHARTMLKSKPLAEVARVLGRSTGAVEKIAKTAPSHLRTKPSPVFLGIRPAKNQEEMKDSPPPTLDDRASIVAFLTAEADRLAAASRAARGDFVEDYGALDRYCDGLMAQADDRRTLAAQIERGDDRQGGQ